jgi:non-heme chloroperoxidase
VYTYERTICCPKAFNLIGYSTTAVLASLRDESLFVDLRQIRVPTLIFQGIHDQICLPQLAPAIQAGIPNSRLIWLTEAGMAYFVSSVTKLMRS